ncbi:HigA family addiction module antitoxin [Pseudomonas sp. S2_B07]
MDINGMRPIHPGEILAKEFLEPLGIELAAPPSRWGTFVVEVIELLAKTRNVSPDLAKMLSGHLNTTPEFWLNLQLTYDLRKAEIERGRALAT